jgi:hypothetical protein
MTHQCPAEDFYLRSGVRQRCLVPPFLFCIIPGVLVSIIGQEKEMSILFEKKKK